MKTLLLINTLLSPAIARCASSSSSFDGAVPLPSQATPTVQSKSFIATVSTLSGESAKIPVGPDTTIIDFKREARANLKLGSFCPTKLICGERVIATDRDLQGIPQIGEPEFMLVIQELTAHSTQETEESKDSLREGEGFVSLRSRKTSTNKNEDGTSIEIEVSIPWDDKTIPSFARTPFRAFWKYGGKVLRLAPDGPFEPKSYAFMAKLTILPDKYDFENTIYTSVKFEISDWDLGSAWEPRFKAKPVGMLVMGKTLPTTFPKDNWEGIYEEEIKSIKERILHNDFMYNDLPLFDTVILPKYLEPEFTKEVEMALLMFEPATEEGFIVTRLQS